MNALDRAIAAVAPGLARRRAENRMALAALSEGGERLRGLDAARRGAHDGWYPAGQGPNALSAADGQRARWAARHEVRNNPVARAAKAKLTAALVGTGFRPRLAGQTGNAVEAVLAAWERGRRYTDPEGLLKFDARLRLGLGAMIEGGFAFLRWRATPDPEQPLVCDVLPAEFLDVARSDRLQRDGRETVYGIEFDQWGRRTGYWLFDHHPEELGWRGARTSQLVPASEVDVIALPQEPGEVIPATWFAPAVTSLVDRKAYLEAERIRMRVQACFGAFLIGAPASASLGLKSSGQPGAAGAFEQQAGATDSYGNPVSALAPGMMVNLPNGTDVKFAEPKGDTSFQQYVDTTTADIAATLGMALFMLSGDMRQVNYSSAQVGYHQFLEQVGVWQTDLVEPLYERAWGRIMAAERRLGRIGERAVTLVPTWARPRRPVADPAKQARADAEEIEAGVSTRGEKFRDRGLDPFEAIDEAVEIEAYEATRRSAMGLPPREPVAAPAARVSEGDEGGDA